MERGHMQWARETTLLSVSTDVTFPMNATWPDNREAMYRENKDCKSPSHPAGIPSSFKRDRA
jgi:hypothetical protein